MSRDRTHAVLVLAAALAAAGCNGSSGPSLAVNLLAPPNGSTAPSRAVTFQWQLQNRPAQVECAVLTDKGQDPLDGDLEDEFQVGDALQLTVDLDPVRYAGETIEWAVRCNGAESEVRTLTLP